MRTALLLLAFVLAGCAHSPIVVIENRTDDRQTITAQIPELGGLRWQPAPPSCTTVWVEPGERLRLRYRSDRIVRREAWSNAVVIAMLRPDHRYEVVATPGDVSRVDAVIDSSDATQPSLVCLSNKWARTRIVDADELMAELGDGNAITRRERQAASN